MLQLGGVQMRILTVVLLDRGLELNHGASPETFGVQVATSQRKKVHGHINDQFF